MSARLLSLEPDLAEPVTDPERRRRALQTLRVDELALRSGDVVDAAALAGQAGFGALLLSGFISRETTVANRTSAELVGPGDVLCPTHVEPQGVTFSSTTSWITLSAVRLALLNGAFCMRVGEYPEIGGALIERACRPGDRSALGRAVAASSNVEVRLLMSLWHWASSWSSVTADGVALSVPLSHERLARLVGASRPTVTTAIGRLRRAGYLDRRRGGQWLLLSPPNGALGEGLAPVADGVRGLAPPSLPARARIRSPWDTRGAKRSELYARIAEQRELLRETANRHVAQLGRLRDQSDSLRAMAEQSELARQARAWLDQSQREPAG